MSDKWDHALDLANVVSIYKKGDSSNLANYRPISLLQVYYKIIAALVKERIDAGLDAYITKTQYGFRKSKSTAHAIFVARRIMDICEQEGSNLSIVLLDWEKAFDKIDHERLIEALERLNLPKNILKMVEKITHAHNLESVATTRHQSIKHKNLASDKAAHYRLTFSC